MVNLGFPRILLWYEGRSVYMHFDFTILLWLGIIIVMYIYVLDTVYNVTSSDGVRVRRAAFVWTRLRAAKFLTQQI